MDPWGHARAVEKLSFVKRINTEHNSIFYSMIKVNNEIIGFGRKHYRQQLIKIVKLNENFDIIEDNNITLVGEDPRCFKYNNKIYILNNCIAKMSLIDYETKESTKIEITGKNISFIEHNNKLFFIHYIKPFKLFTFNTAAESVPLLPEESTKLVATIKEMQRNCVEEERDVCGWKLKYSRHGTGIGETWWSCSAITEQQVDDDGEEYNYEYRGGTPGYKLDDNKYYGYGHRTYIKNNTVIHDIFKWVVYFDQELPRISVFSIDQPNNSKNICDPTCVIEINNKKYLITAETDKTWFEEQDYITNVYEIIE